MEPVRSVFHAQLASVMDSLLAAAVCEIAKIFESCLCEQQAELAQKSREMSILRGRLETERRQRAEGDSADGEGSPTTGSGLNVGNDASCHADSVEGPSPSKLKEEVVGLDRVSIKHECATSQSAAGSATAQAPEGGLAAEDQRRIDGLPATQTKNKPSNWNQSSRSTDLSAPQDQASAPFLSISESGQCSPRSDPSLPQSGDWLSGLDTTRGGVLALENLQADGSSCSAPASSGTSSDPSCFRAAFASDEASDEDNESSFPFLDQEHENQNSNQNSAQGRAVGRSGIQDDPPQAPSGELAWRTRGDGDGRSPINRTRRVTNFGDRDLLRPQSNSPLITLRHTNTLGHPTASGGGNGRPYTCPYCTRCFAYPSHQRRHLLRHTGVRLHPCQFCDKSFLTPSELTVHTRTHTGERPFACAQCGKRFARSGNLRAHQRDVHMGKRPFACTECGKRFAHKGNLRVHNHRVHQGDPYFIEDQPEPDMGANTP
ncbi:zinc finger and SCAN domain-containing protein 2-like [Cololabis saira]|uniref:zinc finger and SCAN domain-containing protein 2-like n=1 Tax=Cololabis saira TaxID=129043 RepID=UPI002AD3E800|nr:zinc finger and SCAN domain-containing protein 2-like [Cololabis saira]